MLVATRGDDLRKELESTVQRQWRSGEKYPAPATPAFNVPKPGSEPAAAAREPTATELWQRSIMDDVRSEDAKKAENSRYGVASSTPA